MSDLYRLNEYYCTEGTSAKVTRHVGDFETLGAARAAADAEYAALSRVPESENVFLAVLDLSRDERVVYSAPEDPLNPNVPNDPDDPQA